MEAREEGTLEWAGEMDVPEGECTVESRGLSVKVRSLPASLALSLSPRRPSADSSRLQYTLTCHLHSTVFAKAGLHVPLPIFLPSAPVELSSPAGLAREPEPEASGSALPAYQP